MRKLIVFMLVLGMASAANAALADFTIATDGLVITVTGVADGSVSGYYIVSGTTIDIAIPQGGSYPIVHTGQSSPYGQNDRIAGDLAAVSTAAAGAPYYDVAQIFAMESTHEDDRVDAGLWFTIDIDDVSTAGWTIGMTVDTLDILDNTATKIGTKAIISTVPEPATIALLGLGGLFLRRRRK